ncbi:MAG: amino acid ABC transporter substrate-binding protein [Ruminococcaceae bacterium]|nr:amino acid ABC transporter substrate-binding protein [Oscillospiraceae bacterium]
MKKILTLALALITVVACLTACGSTGTESGGWDVIAARGEIIVGLDDTFVPMGFRDENNELVGFDIDLAKAVGEYLGIKVTFKPIDWNSKDMELNGGQIDCIWNGMSATEERQQTMALTNKYLNNKIVVMALSETEITVKEAADLANYKVGTQAGSAALEALEANEAYDSYKENISEYDTYDEAILDMQAGRIQCIIVDEVLGEYKNNLLGNTFKTCEYDFGPDYYAIGCRKADTDVAEKLNGAIKALIENGTAAKLSEKWFGSDLVIFEDYK